MSDNAGSGDSSGRQVHPVHPEDPTSHNEDEELHRVLREAAAASAAENGTAGAVEDPHDQELSAADLDAGLSLAAALSDLPPGDDELDHATPQFDPDTLANLAALSRIGHDDEDGEGVMHTGEEHVADDADHDYSSLMIPQPSTLTSEQVQEFVDNLGAAEREEEEEEDHSRAATPATTVRTEEVSVREASLDIPTPRTDVTNDPRTYYEDGKLKRRRNRTVLSCTECHRRKQHCDRNIPCSRCIKRGVPSMCRMEAPPMPQRKRKKMNEDVPLNYELGLRVQALESLIRSGSNMDPDAASNAAMETIMHATRAANQGQPEAVHALAQLTNASSGIGIGGMTQDAQSSLLLDVLQQLSAASMGRPPSFTNNTSSNSNAELRDLWSSVPSAPAEHSVQIQTAYIEDQAPVKVNLSLMGFREDNGKVFLPPTVKYAEKKMREDSAFSHEVLPIEGYAPFLDSATRFAYGEDSPVIKHRRVASIQAMSITGALRLASTFLSRFPAPAGARSIYIPNPTSDEDIAALKEGGLDIKVFRYLDQKHGMVDWDGMRDDLQSAPPRSAVLLFVSGSVPTGAEFTAPQWRMVTSLLQERQLIPVVIMAFQGLSSGDVNRDAQPLRFMVHENVPVVLVQSFDAMMGLYSDSPAVVSIPTPSTEDRDRVNSQLKSLARAMYFHPPAWGAQLAHTVLSDKKLYPAWLNEIRAMSDRLRSVREKLHDVLVHKLKTPGNWAYLKRASGMYCTLLIPQGQMEALTSKRHIHLLPDGCFSLGCLNAQRIDMLARSVDWVVREGIREAEDQAQQAIAMELALQAAKEQQAREEAEAAAAAEAAEAAAAQAEDALLMEASIQSAIEAQRVAEEEERRREEEARELEEEVRKAAERAEIARQAELILATI